MTLERFVRPDGRAYRPRRVGLRAYGWAGDSGSVDACGVVVIGTLDPARARPLAQDAARYWHGRVGVDAGVPGWYREGYAFGELAWVEDDRRGAPGVYYHASEE